VKIVLATNNKRRWRIAGRVRPVKILRTWRTWSTIMTTPRDIDRRARVAIWTRRQHASSSPLESVESAALTQNCSREMNKDNVPGKEHAGLVKARDSYLERSRSRLTVNKGGFDHARARARKSLFSCTPFASRASSRRRAAFRRKRNDRRLFSFFLFPFLSCVAATGNG